MTVLRLGRQSRGLGLSPRRRAAKGGSQVPMLVQAGLIAEWRFDEGAGQVLTDHTGNGHHGRLGSTTGADAADPVWTARGLSFDGGDFVECDDAGISGSAPRTLIAVMRLSDRGDGEPSAGVEWRDGSSVGGGLWMMRVHDANPQQARLSSGNANIFLNVSPSWSVGEWHFFASTLSGSNFNTARLHVDGQVGTTTDEEEIDTQANLFFGRANFATVPMEAAYGLVYDRALSPAEVEQNRQALKAILAGRGIALP